MKTGTSTLNPYATAYVPISKRSETKDLKAEESKTGNEYALAWESQPDIYSVPSLDTFQTAKSPKLKGHPKYGNYEYEAMEKQIADEAFEMDMAYLQMTFPGISVESLSDVYLVNNSDLEGAVDMLNQLELYSDSSEKQLPESLDIGDVAEGGSPQKLKNVSVEAVASSSGI